MSNDFENSVNPDPEEIEETETEENEVLDETDNEELGSQVSE